MRDGLRVRSRYVQGSGLPADVGDMLRQHDRRARERAAEDRETWAADRAAMDEADRLAATIDREYRGVADLALVATGHRLSRQHGWRKRRATNMPTKNTTKPNDTSALPTAAEVHALLDALDRARAEGADDAEPKKAAFDAAVRLRAAAQSGDEAAMPGVRVILDRRPAMWPMIPTFESAVGDVTLSMTATKDLLGRELGVREIRAVRDELAGPNPTPLERLLAERAALAYAAALRADILTSRNLHVGAHPSTLEHVSRMQSRADARFHAAVKSLATVRRMAMPVLMIHRAEDTPKPVATTPQSDRLRIVAGEGG